MNVVPTVLSISRGVGLCKRNERAISATSIHTHMDQQGLFFFNPSITGGLKDRILSLISVLKTSSEQKIKMTKGDDLAKRS